MEKYEEGDKRETRGRQEVFLEKMPKKKLCPTRFQELKIFLGAPFLPTLFPFCSYLVLDQRFFLSEHVFILLVSSIKANL